MPSGSVIRSVSPWWREAAEVTASRYNFGVTEEQLARKAALRKKLAALSFSEKIKILEKLRDRSLAFAEARRMYVASKAEKVTTENSGFGAIE